MYESAVSVRKRADRERESIEEALKPYEEKPARWLDRYRTPFGAAFLGRDVRGAAKLLWKVTRADRYHGRLRKHLNQFFDARSPVHLGYEEMFGEHLFSWARRFLLKLDRLLHPQPESLPRPRYVRPAPYYRRFVRRGHRFAPA